MLKFETDRSVAFFDIEATGTNPRADRIIDLAIVKVLPAGEREEHHWRVNPERPIPPDASAIHGIMDEDVKDSPTFKGIALHVAGILEGCDLAGYNVIHYDIPMLTEEFIRSGVPFSMDGRRVLDAQRIYHKREPRDLSAALKFYCGEMHLGAHGAMDDVHATIRVVEGQFEKYADLPKNMTTLNELCNTRNPAWVDSVGKFKWVDGEATINFGKQGGRKLRELAADRDGQGFLRWMLKSDFARDTKEIVTNALAGKFPKPPTASDA